jgi:hypothetical protein
MIRKKPAPDLIRSGNRFSEKIMLEHNVRGDDDSKRNIIPLEDIAEEVTRIVRFRQEACGINPNRDTRSLFRVAAKSRRTCRTCVHY